MDGFPDATGNETAEQGDVGVGDVIIALSTRSNYAKERDVVLY
jgi:hypothetical protein